MLQDVDDTILDVIDVERSERIYGSSSSVGNQVKWKSGDRYIKKNCLGYEDIAEVLVSHFLSFTNLSESEYVKYTACRIVEDGKYVGVGCYSEDFKGDASEVSVSFLLDMSCSSYSMSYDELRDFLYDIVKFDVKPYLDKILCIDAITRNDDRHYKNICFLYKDGVYSPCPIFDNGSSCMSDLISYPMDADFERNYGSIQAKPFYTDFSKNLHNNECILVHYDEFLNSVNAIEPYSKRALQTLKKGLRDTEGLAWKRW